MKILAADDERLALEVLIEAIHAALPEAPVFAFGKPSELLEFAKENPCDVAFLDIEMRGMSGVELAQRLKKLTPHTYIIFVTGYSQYLEGELNSGNHGFVLKPATREAIKMELDNMGNYEEPEAYIRVKTFGSFELLVDNRPVNFSDSKQKEMLAYIIDKRGAAVSANELVDTVFTDMKKDFFFRKKIKNEMAALISDLHLVGAEDIISVTDGVVAAKPEAFRCDSYDFIRMKSSAINSYCGEYMSQYVWADFDVRNLET